MTLRLLDQEISNISPAAAFICLWNSEFDLDLDRAVLSQTFARLLAMLPQGAVCCDLNIFRLIHS